MNDVMERLRTETRDLHESAESHDFQRRLAGGAVSRGEYGQWLGQMLLIHRALEDRLEPCIDSDERFAAVKRGQFQVPHLLADLDALELDASSLKRLDATSDLVARIEADAEAEPLRLLGYHYVLEGSNNGNRFISRALLPSLGLERDRGGRYLDPYGSEQPAVWKRFKADMSEVGFSSDEKDLLVDAARTMFESIGDLSAELVSQGAVAG